MKFSEWETIISKLDATTAAQYEEAIFTLRSWPEFEKFFAIPTCLFEIEALLLQRRSKVGTWKREGVR